MIPENVARELADGRYERIESGIVVPRAGMFVQGRLRLLVNGRPKATTHNLLCNEGIALISAALGVFPSPVYGALFQDDVTPLATWTGATFGGLATELTSGTEGYVESTRVLLADLTGVTPMEFNMRTASTVQGCGIALLDGSTKGSTGDSLIAAARFPDAPEIFDNLDILDVFYVLTATPL